MLNARKLAVALSTAAATALATHASAQIANPQFLGAFTLPTGLLLNGVEFGGISGLDYDPATGLFYAISDDRVDRGPARFYTLKLNITETGIAQADIVGMTEIRGADGAIARNGLDGEGIRFDAARNVLYWSSERDTANIPAIFEINPDGTYVRGFAIPAYYLPTADGAAGTYGNLAFEGLTIAADGTGLWAATENALAQDGPRATLDAGSRSRFVRFDLATGAPVAEYLYVTEPVFTAATVDPFINDRGITEIVALDDTTFLVTERSFALGVGNQIDFFIATIDGATDVNGQATVAAEAVAMSKTHLLTIGEGDFGLDIDNIEAVTFGPMVAGKRTLVIASDNNFAANQFTQFVVFTLE